MRETGELRLREVLLYESEQRALAASARCPNCGHSAVFHNDDDQGSFCLIDGCVCVDGRFPDEWSRRACERCQRVLLLKNNEQACGDCQRRLDLEAEVERRRRATDELEEGVHRALEAHDVAAAVEILAMLARVDPARGAKLYGELKDALAAARALRG